MNILLLGGLGFLGRNCGKFLKKSHQVYVVDRVDVDLENYYKCELHQTDKLVSIIKQNNIDCIMHFVSSLIPSSSQDQFLDDIEKVYIPSVKLIEYCALNRIKFVYISSGGAVYGNQREVFNEKTKREPVSLYGLSKLNFENALSFYNHMHNLDYMIIRPSNPYGYGQNLYGKQGIIAVLMGKILRQETFEIWGDGSAVKDYIYIDDFCFYVDFLIGNSDSWNDVYNIGSGVGNSVNNVLEAFRKCGITLPRIQYNSASSTDVRRMILDCTKLQEKVNHNCVELEDGIQKFWEQVNENTN